MGNLPSNIEYFDFLLPYNQLFSLSPRYFFVTVYLTINGDFK
jgi:hypothetical protein